MVQTRAGPFLLPPQGLFFVTPACCNQMSKDLLVNVSCSAKLQGLERRLLWGGRYSATAKAATESKKPTSANKSGRAVRPVEELAMKTYLSTAGGGKGDGKGPRLLQGNILSVFCCNVRLNRNLTECQGKPAPACRTGYNAQNCSRMSVRVLAKSPMTKKLCSSQKCCHDRCWHLPAR